MICPVCKGKGSYRAPYYSEFHGPSMEDVPCVCIKKRSTMAGLWTAVLFVAAMALVAWCAS